MFEMLDYDSKNFRLKETQLILFCPIQCVLHIQQEAIENVCHTSQWCRLYTSIKIAEIQLFIDISLILIHVHSRQRQLDRQSTLTS